MFENVRAAAEFSYPKDAPPVQPPVKTVEQDVLELGYHFVSCLPGTSFFVKRVKEFVDVCWYVWECGGSGYITG